MKAIKSKMKGSSIMNYKPPFAGENLATDIERIKELKNIKSVRIIRRKKNGDVTVTFNCETVPGITKEISFAPWNVKYKSNRFYLDNPILWFFDDKKNCYEDAVAFTLACIKALNKKGVNVNYSSLLIFSPAEIANKLIDVYPSTLIEF